MNRFGLKGWRERNSDFNCFIKKKADSLYISSGNPWEGYPRKFYISTASNILIIAFEIARMLTVVDYIQYIIASYYFTFMEVRLHRVHSILG